MDGERTPACDKHAGNLRKPEALPITQAIEQALDRAHPLSAVDVRGKSAKEHPYNVILKQTNYSGKSKLT